MLNDPQAIKIINFTHPPRQVRSVKITRIHYPYSLTSAGESGELFITLDTGVGCNRLTPHALLGDVGSRAYTASTNFINAYLVGVFPHRWETEEAIVLNPTIAIMPQLRVSMTYVGVDGGSRV